METPDFERMAEEFFPVGITQTLEGADSIVMDKNGDGLRRLLSEMLQSVHNDALGEAAARARVYGCSDPKCTSCIGGALESDIREMMHKDTPATKEDGDG